MKREVLAGAVLDVHERAATRAERLQALEQAIRAFNATPAEAEEIVLTVQGALQLELAGAMLFDVDPAFDSVREALTELQRSLDDTDQPADETDLSRADRQRRDDDAAEVQS